MSRLEALSLELSALSDQLAQLERLERRQRALETELKQAGADAARLQKQVQREEADVRKLEEVSLSNLLVSLFADKDARLHKERQEAVAAQLKFDEAQKLVHDLTAEQEQVRAEMRPYAGVRERYKALHAEKEAAMRGRGDDSVRTLFQLSDQAQDFKAQAKEVAEALKAGLHADAALARVIECLESAAGWGTWDLLGGGMIATAVKHSRLNDAQKAVHQAQMALSAYRRELKDVNLSLSVTDLPVDGFTRFADFFFDNLLTDWMVQSRINASLQSVRQTRNQVGQIQARLQERQRALKTEMESAAQNLTHFVERYQPDQGQT